MLKMASSVFLVKSGRSGPETQALLTKHNEAPFFSASLPEMELPPLFLFFVKEFIIGDESGDSVLFMN